MALRWGFGPVFANEWLTTSRRWQSYAGRTVFVAALLRGLSTVWVARTNGQSLPPIHATAEIGVSFYNTIVFMQLTLVLLAAPAATAGAICQDKSSGTLAQMLLTDLSIVVIARGPAPGTARSHHAAHRHSHGAEPLTSVAAAHPPHHAATHAVERGRYARAELEQLVGQ
jgi:hypothetical protein